MTKFRVMKLCIQHHRRIKERTQSSCYAIGIFILTSFNCLALSNVVCREGHCFGRLYEGLTDNYMLPNDSTNSEFQVKVKSKIISRVSSQDARGNSNNQIEVSIIINGCLVATFEDIGDMDFDDSTNKIFIDSSISSKVYTIEALDSNTIIITKKLWFEGVENRIWTRTYKSQWILTGCQGECQ